ncbi:hypothetical protein [Blastomonas sp.]|uniref:hypothetical protein n=1 Tax=Blastomonas sp. TaxID=1909299 RepID=UPI003593E726
MMPILRMTAPAGVHSLTDVPFVPGQRLFRSRLLLGGFFPVGTSHLTLEVLESGVGFVEQSPMTGMKSWRHERTFSDEGTGCRVTDALAFEPSMLPSLTRRITSAFFLHRHRRLQRRFGVRV